MKTIFKIIMYSALLFSFIIISTSLVSALDENLNIRIIKDEGSQVKENKHLENIESDEDWKVKIWWEKWIHNTLFKIARDLKNVFFAIATIFYLVIVFKVLFADNSEEEFSKFKKWIIWITAWIIVMQISYAFVKTLFDRWVSDNLAFELTENIIFPLIEILQTWAAFFFISVAIFTFYIIVTANWDEEKIKSWKMSIVYAIIWFITVKFAKDIVEAVYWKIDCQVGEWFIIQWYNNRECINKAELTWLVDIIVNVINWMNSIVWIIVVIMIIYAWIQVLLSAWTEEKLKKAKMSILYIAIWVAILITNYLILSFFIIPETII